MRTSLPRAPFRPSLRAPRLTGFLACFAIAGLRCSGPGDSPIRGRFAPVTPGAARHLVLEGTPSEMGRAMGRLLRDEVRAFVARPLPDALAPQLVEYAAAMRPLASAAHLEEEEAMAKEAGVRAFDLFVREAARDGLRWHDAAGAARTASFASVPGDVPDVVVAPADPGLDASALIVVERHPAHGAASLVLARVGETGAVAGVGEDGLVVAGAEIAVAAEARTLKAAPFTWSIRAAIERGGDASAVFRTVAPLCGHRLLIADRANVRMLGTVSLGSEPPVALAPTAWGLAAADPGEPAALARALEQRLSTYATRPGAGEAVSLALAGRPRDAIGPVLRCSPQGLVLEVGVGADGIAGPEAIEEYRWAVRPGSGPDAGAGVDAGSR